MNELDSGKQMSSSSCTENNVIFLLVQIGHALESHLETALEEVALSLAKMGALSKLVDEGEALTLSDLASRLTCVRSNITQLVDRLEADGLVKREEDPSDRRGVKAALTELGRERHALGVEKLREVQQRLLKHLSTMDAKMLNNVLTKLK
ncbi:MAG: MarR family transcriptional regulator [Nitrospirae bacterium]|nr:MarR family transcriptional regulator [Nitrospirota bacterium]